MEKTLTIDGRQVPFKCTAGTLIRYRNQFNREFLSDMAKMKDLKADSIDGLSLDPFYEIVWIMAKTADQTIPDLLPWLDTFDAFPILDIFGKLQELVMACLQTKNSSAAGHPVNRKQRRHR